MGSTRKRKVPGFWRSILAQNLSVLIEHRYSGSANRPMQTAKAAGVSLSTVQRILKEESGATLDNIEALAAAFDLSAYQLLIPELSPANPQLVAEATAAEKRLYRRWQQAKLRGDEAEPSQPPK